MMRALFISAVVFTILFWLFAAGWAGQLVLTPDTSLLRRGDWLQWTLFMLLMYGPILIAGWALVRLLSSKKTSSEE